MASRRVFVSSRRDRLAVFLLVTAGLFGDSGCAEPPRSPAPRSSAADARRATDDDLRLFPESPSFRLPPRAAALLPARSSGGRAPRAARTAPAADVASVPGRLPSAAGGMPVVVKAANPFRVVRRPEDRVVRTSAETPAPRRLDPAPDAEAEIRAMFRDYLSAFNRHDPLALAAHWSGACESVDLASGDVTRGRGEVEEVFAALFRTDDAATIDLQVESVRLLRDDVALVDAVSSIRFSAEGGPEQARSRLAAVVARERGRWMIESVRESPLPPLADGRPLDALDWLVGEWEDAGDGITATTRCFWSTGRAFLIRCHSAAFDPADRLSPAADADGIPDLLPPGASPVREVTEIIGWDPATETIRSWVFTSEGRFAEGVWTRRGDRWLVRMDGRGADSGAACTATLERIGTAELAFRCTGDALAEAMPPACDFTRVAEAGATAPETRSTSVE